MRDVGPQQLGAFPGFLVLWLFVLGFEAIRQEEVDPLVVRLAMHHAHDPEPVKRQRHADFLLGLPKRGLGDGLAGLDVTRHDAQPTVLESRVAPAHEQDRIASEEENVDGDGKPRVHVNGRR